jgi:hypothetical protein
MGQGVVLSGQAAAGKDAVCAFISILAGAGGRHTLVKREKGGQRCAADFVSQLRTAWDGAAVQNNYLLDSVGRERADRMRQCSRNAALTGILLDFPIRVYPLICVVYEFRPNQI